MKKILFCLFLFLICLFPSGSYVRASDLEVYCTGYTPACTKTGLDPLFDRESDGYWYPGQTTVKSLRLTNAGSAEKEMVLSPQDISGDGELGNVFEIRIVSGSGREVIWQGSMAEFLKKGQISFGRFPPGASREFNFLVSLENSAGNLHQDRTVSFGLVFGFWENSPAPAPVSSRYGSGAADPTKIPFASNNSTVTGFSGAGSGEANQTAGITPGASVSAAGQIPGTVLGSVGSVGYPASGGICSNNLNWLVYIILQIILASELIIVTRWDKSYRPLFIQAMISLISIHTSGRYLCEWLMAPLAGIIGITGIAVSASLILRQIVPLSFGGGFCRMKIQA